MAAANTAIGLAGLLGGIVIRPAVQQLLPPFLQQYLNVNEPSAEAANIPFRIEYRPTPCDPTVLPPSNTIAVVDNQWDIRERITSVGFWVILALILCLVGAVAFSRRVSTTANEGNINHTAAPEQEDEDVKTDPGHNEATSGGIIAELEATEDIPPKENDEVQREITNLKAAKHSLAAENDAVQEKIADLEAALEITKAALDTVNNTAQAQIKALEAEIQQVTEKSNEDIEKLKADSDTPKSDKTLKDLRKQLDETSKSLGEYMIKVETLEESNNKFSDQTQKANSAKDKAETQANRLRTENNTLQSSFEKKDEELKTKLAGKDEEVSQLKSDKKKLKGDVDGLNSSLEKESDANTHAKESIAELQQKLSSADSNISRLESEKQQLEKTSTGLKEDHDREKSVKEQAEKELVTLRGKYSDVMDQSSKLQDETQQLKQTVADRDQKILTLESEQSKKEILLQDVMTKCEAIVGEKDRLKSLLAKECRCKRSGGSNSKDDNKDDDEDGSGNDPDSDQNSGNSDGSQADDTAKPDPHDQQDDAASNDDSPAPDASAGDSEPGLQPTDFDSGFQDRDDLGADDTANTPTVKLPSKTPSEAPSETPSETPAQTQSASPFVRPLGWDRMSKSQQRNYHRYWKIEHDAHQDPQRAHANLEYMIRKGKAGRT